MSGSPYQHGDLVAAGPKPCAGFQPGPVQIDPVWSLRGFGEFLGGQDPGQPVGAVRARPRGQQVTLVAYGGKADRVHRAPFRGLVHSRVVDAHLVSGEHHAPDPSHYGVGHLLSDQPTREEVGLRVDEQSLGHAGAVSR